MIDGRALVRAFRRGRTSAPLVVLHMTTPPWFGVVWDHNLATDETEVRIFVPKRGDTTTIHFVYAKDELDAYLKLRDLVEGKLDPWDYLLTVDRIV